MSSPPSGAALSFDPRILPTWCGALGATGQWPEHAIEFAKRPDLKAAICVALGTTRIVAAPTWAIKKLQLLAPDDLFDAAVVAAALGEKANPIGTATLSYATGEPPFGEWKTRPATTDDLATVREPCTVAEWEESGLGEMQRRWVSTEADETVALSGFDTWRSATAQMGVLASPGWH